MDQDKPASSASHFEEPGF